MGRWIELGDFALFGYPSTQLLVMHCAGVLVSFVFHCTWASCALLTPAWHYGCCNGLSHS